MKFSTMVCGCRNASRDRTACRRRQRALQHIDEDVAVERAPLVQEPARAYEIAAGVKGYGIWSKGIQAVHERFPPI